MGGIIELTAADGHRLQAYRAGSEGAAKGLVVVQEIFGLNGYLRRTCDAMANQGYAVAAPALFDRVERGVSLGYGPADVARGRALKGQAAEAGVLADVEAAAALLGDRPLGIVGFCWGGTVAWWAATRTSRFRAAVGWYGGGIAAERDAAPRCKVQLHFGEEDASIPMGDVAAIRAARPEVEVFTYPGAGHGFGCDERDSFNVSAAAVAGTRTLAFLARNV